MSQRRFLVKFSWRNLGRNPLRTLIMALGLAFGTGYIIFALNFSRSGGDEITDDFLAQYVGQHQIVASGYYPGSDKKKFDYNYVLPESAGDSAPELNYVPRTTLPVFLSGPKKTLGTLLVGIDPAREYELTQLKKAMASGKFLKDDGQMQIMLGAKLARKLGVKIGDEVAAIGQALDGSVANDIFRLVALMDFGGGDMEESFAFTTVQSSRVLGVIPDGHVHQLVSFTRRQTHFPEALSGTEIVPWSQIVPEVHGSVMFIDVFTWIVAVIIVVVISLGMGNTLMITFLERQKEFHALTVIGTRSSWIARSLALEVLMLGLLGICFGVVIGNLVSLYFHYNPISLLMFTGGKPIMMGGMAIMPKIRLTLYPNYSWQAPLLVLSFLFLSLIYPIYQILQRSRRAH
jgi:ABC-type lipoprotein release transport system permease subunit